MQLILSLGTNLGNRRENLAQALRLLSNEVGQVVSVAKPVETLPVGFSSENLFLNTVAVVETDLPAEDILHLTQDIERRMGRTQKSTDGVYHDRLIDIDLLFFGSTCLFTSQLQLPHRHLDERLFVLEPLAEVAPQLVHPLLGKPIAELLEERKRCLVQRLLPQQCTALLAERINHLLRQLSANAPTVSATDLAETASRERLYLLYDSHEQPLGMATLCIDHLLTGPKAWIEDVVVDAAARGQGFATILLTKLLSEARYEGAKSVNLTSRPARAAANRLYQRLGFVQRETNVYKFSL